MTKPQIIIPSNTSPRPKNFEISAAMILAQFFDEDVKFIARQTITTPDIEIAGIRWEIKSPTGKGKRNIQHQIHRALKQSANIVFDARKSKIRITKIRTDLLRYSTENKHIKRLILIEKDEKVVIIK